MGQSYLRKEERLEGKLYPFFIPIPFPFPFGSSTETFCVLL